MTLELGVIVPLTPDPAAQIRKVADLGLGTCQLASWDASIRTPELGRKLTAAARDAGVTVTALWAGWSGPKAWNFADGPSTIGLVPPEHRDYRVAELQQAAQWAAELEFPAIVTHCGFIPEHQGDPLWPGTVAAITQVAARCRELGIEFWFESGQETPVTLLRTIAAVGTGNLGVNLDPANLILYGKANPVDALDVVGPYVRGVHAKDGLYPTDPAELGRETPLGEGKVNFPALVSRLKACGFEGALTIEREIGGPRQIEDIRKAISLLRPLC